MRWASVPLPGVIPGFEVSDSGVVKDPTGRERPQYIRGDYMSVGLKYSDGSHRQVATHRVVAWAFLGPPPFERALVLHGDGNPLNNAASNLRWGTYSENTRDSVSHGTHRNTRKIACPQGHDYDEVDSRGNRTCSACVKKRSRTGLPPGDPRHSTLGGYVRGCRCEGCTRANREYQRERKKVRSLPKGDPRHGTLNGYNNYRCRCGDCRKSNTDAARKRRGD